jgi:hypothetical protein
VIVESFSPADFMLTLEVDEPTVPTDVMLNENCATAHVVPATGGLFHGNTSMMANNSETGTVCGGMATSNDAVFALTLDRTQSVIATTEGSAFDTVLHYRLDCESATPLECDDDSGDGPTSVLDLVLDAGTHYFVVDGFGAGNHGEYYFEVLVEDP